MSRFFGIARFLARRLPPTIHPMILHFPIVLLYLTAGIDIAGRLLTDRDRQLQRTGFWALTLACFFTVLTMAAGFIGEQSVHWTPTTRAILERHQRFAMLTGLSEGAAWLIRLGTRFPGGRGWTMLGRGRATWVSTLLVVASAVCVTITAQLGGQMVYGHGAGVAGIGRLPGA